MSSEGQKHAAKLAKLEQPGKNWRTL